MQTSLDGIGSWWIQLIKYSKWRCKLKMSSKLITHKVEDEAEVLEEIVVEVKVLVKMKRKSNLINKIGVKEDEVHGEKVSWAPQIFSALSMTNMTIMQKSVTLGHSVKNCLSENRREETTDFYKRCWRGRSIVKDDTKLWCQSQLY